MSTTSSSPARRRLRQPRLADMIADALRDRILDGEIADGAMLPKQEDLLEEFGVSMPSVREALRILETEGLVTVLRGNTGGAAVRRPRADTVAYMIALVLQADAVEMSDVVEAMCLFEPLCTALAAGREDRHETVVPALRALLAESEAAFDDVERYMQAARAFHEELVAGCGNRTLILICGAMESLWSAHVAGLSRATATSSAFADPAFREHSLLDHEQIVEAIAAGDATRAEALARTHLSHPERHPLMHEATTVRARLLRGS